MSVAQNSSDLSLPELELSVRAVNCLESNDIVLVSQLITYSKEELAAIPGIGALSVKEIQHQLEKVGLALSAEPSIKHRIQEKLMELKRVQDGLLRLGCGIVSCMIVGRANDYHTRIAPDYTDPVPIEGISLSEYHQTLERYERFADVINHLLTEKHKRYIKED